MPIFDLEINIILVFFIYGLAFYSMGLAMLSESGRSPLLAGRRTLRPLAVFGIVHGIHEWVEMFLAHSEWFELRFPVEAAWLRLVLLTVSFTALLAFSLRVFRPHNRLSTRDLAFGFGLLVLYTLLVVVVLSHRDPAVNPAVNPAANRLLYIDALSRYTLAVPGACLAALALHRQAAAAAGEKRRVVANRLQWAAWSFALYAITQAFVPPLDFFPANVLNTAVFLSVTGMPVQVVRAVLAVSITAGLIHATQVVEAERQREFLTMQQARLDALEQVRQDLVERETLRRDLLRHTVIAQEEERARIARELHDETAQVLTAFSLNLATLHASMPEKPQVSELLVRLQGLNRQMADGIYRMVHDLRPAQLDDLGLVAALQYLAEEQHKRTGLNVHLEFSGPRQRLDPLVETVFFRVAQEALVNVARHACTQEVSVRLLFTPQHVLLSICDQGAGFDVAEHMHPPHGWGLAGMRERADSIGARLRLHSAPGQGTQVEIQAPFLEVADGDDSVDVGG